jgi:hippurate hydrolase
MHVAWLMGVTCILAGNRTAWRGTVIAVFQPGEETGQGARAMIEDGMVKRFPRPDVTLGQQVMPLSAGHIGWRPGTYFLPGIAGRSPCSAAAPMARCRKRALIRW